MTDEDTNATEFSQVEIVEPSTLAKNVRRKKKKSVPYNEDPEILKRLAQVARFMLEGMPAWQIAEKQRCSLATAKRDIKRVRELWKTDAEEQIESLLGDALAVYKKVQTEAWQKITANPDRADRYLNVVLAAQKQVDNLAGIAPPKQVNVNLEGELDVRDIDTVRDERWQQIAERLQDALKG